MDDSDQTVYCRKPPVLYMQDFRPSMTTPRVTPGATLEIDPRRMSLERLYISYQHDRLIFVLG
jgi:hypothetical protein